MTNSDSGNRHAHHPGDRVRVKHNLRHDHHSYSVEQNRARQALAGQIGSIRERAPSGAYRVAPPGSTERGAWFEADELEAPLPPIGSRVRVKAGLHEGRVLVVKQHRGGEVLAEQGPRMGWYDPSEVEPWGGEEPIVTDADGLPVGGPTSPLVDRPVPELRAGVLAIVDALEAKLSIANAEAARWHAAAQEAQGEARDARAARLAGEAERDALRAACEAVVGPAVGVSAEALAHGVKEALAAQMAAVMRTADHRCADARRIAALEARVTAVRAAWGKMRALLLGLHRPLGAVWLDALEAVDAALGGVAAKPEREDCWEQTVEQRVFEVEARLGRLEAMGTGMGTEATARARASRSNEGANR